MVFRGHSWFFVVIHGLSWPYMAEFGRPVAILDHKKLPTLGELLNHDMPSEFRPKPKS